MRKTILATFAAAAVGVALFATPAIGSDGYGVRDDRGDRNHDRECSSSPGRNSYGRDLNVVGLVASQRLICFEADKPGKAKRIGAVSGLVTDTMLVGIDFRPASGALYGLGNAGGVYTLNTGNAQAMLRSRLNVALNGASFGVDFNPTVDRLRVVSDTGQNLRVNVDDGTTTVDATLNYVGPPPVNPAPGVAGAAYTNNDADPNTATTLFDVDAMLDQVAIQAPPNAGTLNATGKLGVGTDAAVGFDIYSTIRNGTTVDTRGLASLTTSNSSGLYDVNLLTGKANFVGSFKTPVIGVAIPLNQR